MSVLVLVELGVLASLFPSYDVRLQAGLVFALASLVVGVPLLRQVTWPSAPHRRLLVGMTLAAVFADLTRYFWIAERADIEFTVTERYAKDIEHPFSPALQATLRQRWRDPDPGLGFAGGVAWNMPIASVVWPVNSFMVSRYLADLFEVSGRRPAIGPDLKFFPGERVGVARGGAREVVAPHGDLLLAADAGAPPPHGSAGAAGSGEFRYGFRSWRYNGFRIDVETPTDGWVLLAQIFDPAWRIEVDGRPVEPRRAEHMLMAIPVDAGTRTVQMEYRPRARRLYWPASALLLATCAGLLVAARRAALPNRQRTSGRASAVTTVS